MKKGFYLVLMCASLLWNCDNGNNGFEVENPDELNKEGVITMVPLTDKIEDLLIKSFKEGDLITFDWGDGKKEEFKTAPDDPIYKLYYCKVKHAYSNANQYEITIKGNIQDLICNSSKLISLDASKCTALNILSCNNNGLTLLDMSKNTILRQLDCGHNNLSTLDMSKNMALTALSCDNNNLSALDVSKNTALTVFTCSHNNLFSLDVSINTDLDQLNCRNNNLSALDISKNTALRKLDCGDNNLSTLDVSKNTALTSLICGGNNLSTLDVSKNTVLTTLDCSDNNLTASALNDIFKSLPIVNEGYLYIGSNPGYSTCDTSIAEKKGWNIRL